MMTTASAQRVQRLIDTFSRSDYVNARQFGSSSDDWIGDPERADRCDAAAEYGADGSTHAEHIDDLRSAWSDYLRDRPNSIWKTLDRLELAIDAHFDDLVAWHEANGSLDQEVG